MQIRERGLRWRLEAGCCAPLPPPDVSTYLDEVVAKVEGIKDFRHNLDALRIRHHDSVVLAGNVNVLVGRQSCRHACE